MARIYCFKHPSYDGNDSPVLSCKTCCGIFVATLKAQREDQAKLDDNAAPAPAASVAEKPAANKIEQWFEQRRRANTASSKADGASKSGFRPELI